MAAFGYRVRGHMAAAIAAEGGLMRAFALSLLAAVALAAAAQAQPVDVRAKAADTADDAASATGACISAIVAGAPVGDVSIGEVSIRRGKDPVSCTVTVTGGQPVVVRDAVLTAIAARSEGLVPARSKWDPESFASRETFCNLPSRRNVLATVSTGKPGARVVLVATVTELKDRDARCDRDLGVQKIGVDQGAQAKAATADPPPPAARSAQVEKKGIRKWLRVPWSKGSK
jgi:hypothetical protein